MKKSFLLAVIPALMVLASCAGAGVKEEIKQEPKILEDTLAHEEIFGGVGEALDLKVMTPRRAVELVKPVTGVQYQQTGDTYAIRFVAAIADYQGVEAVWTRAICESNGTEHNNEGFAEKVCEQAYTSLSAAGSAVTPGATPSEFGTGFNYFVVYTLRNIPSSQLDSCLCAYLTVKQGENEEKSLVRVSTLGAGHTFTFDQSQVNGYFLQGKIGNETIVPLINKSNDQSSGNYAEKENIPMNAEDYFGIYKFDPADNCFQCFADFESGNDISNFKNRSRRVFNNGSYNIYISRNSANKVYFNGTISSVRMYLNATSLWDTADPLPRFAAYAFNNAKTEIAWFNMTATSIEHTYQVDVTPNVYDQVIFCRIDANNSKNAWNNDGGSVWNQTQDLSFPSANGLSRKIAITDWNSAGDWYSVDI